MRNLIFTILAFYCLTGFSSPPVYFNEISYKDTTSDWIELKINSKVNGLLEIKSSKWDIKIPSEKLKNKNFILIYLNKASKKEKISQTTYEIHLKNHPLKNKEDKLCLYLAKTNIQCLDWKNSKISRNESIIKENNWKLVKYPTPGKENGESSNKIQINEIFPNPKGKDKNREWIELKNLTNTKINLKNWKLNETTLNSTIEKYLIIHLPLKNSKNTITLRDFTNKQIDQISHKNIPEGSSYSRSSTNEWFLSPPTKNQKNKTLKTKTGFITKLSPFEINYKPYKHSLPQPLINASLKKGQIITYQTTGKEVHKITPLHKPLLLHYVIDYLYKLSSSNLMIRVKSF